MLNPEPLTTWAELRQTAEHPYDLLEPLFDAVPVITQWTTLEDLDLILTTIHGKMTVIDSVNVVQNQIKYGVIEALPSLRRLADIYGAEWSPLDDYKRNVTETIDRDTTAENGGADTVANTGTDTTSTTQDETSQDVYAMDQQATPNPLSRTRHNDTASTTYGGTVTTTHGRTTTGTDDTTRTVSETATRTPPADLIKKALEVYDINLARELVNIIVATIAVPIYLEEE